MKSEGMVTTVEAKDVQTALDEAKPDEEIAVKGRATIKEPVVIDTPGVTLRGLQLDLADAADEHMVVVVADGVRLVDFQLNGNRENQPGDRQSNGVVVSGVSNVTVADGFVERASRHGVIVKERTSEEYRIIASEIAPDAAQTSDVTVRNVRIESPRRDGCSIDGCHEKGTITDIRVENVRTFDSEDRGSVEVKDGVSSVVVTNCHAEDCLYGVTVQDHSPHGVNGVIIAHNTAVACNRAIHSQPTNRHRNVVVIGNVGRDIAGMTTQKYPEGAFYLGLIDGLVLTKNIVEGAGETGFQVYDSPDAQVTGNRIDTVSDGAGITITDSPGAIVNGNTVRNASGNGILYRATQGEVFDHAPLSTAGPLQDSQICHNRCVDNDGYGIALRTKKGSINHTLVSDNVVRNNREGGVDLEAAGSKRLASNNLS